MPDQILYTAEARATGDGRDGHTRTSDGRRDLDLAFAKELGGSGGGINPEQLFGCGYSGCFHSALRLVAREAKADVSDASVTALAGIGTEDGSYGPTVTLRISLPYVATDEARKLADEAHQICPCPYSRATRRNIPVTLEIV
jgi:Ohr subfamily peroxiredoxin